MYRVVMTRSAPSQLGGAHYMQMLDYARAAARVMPPADAPLAFSFILAPQGPVLTWADAHPEVNPGDALLLRHALGIDLQAAAVEAGTPPRLMATRDLGVALAYLPTHGGIVTGIDAIEPVRAMPGVVEVTIFAQPGDTLGHVIDTASRNAGGYVLAVGATVRIALARAAAARDAIEIHVESVQR